MEGISKCLPVSPGGFKHFLSQKLPVLRERRLEACLALLWIRATYKTNRNGSKMSLGCCPWSQLLVVYRNSEPGTFSLASLYLDVVLSQES